MEEVEYKNIICDDNHNGQICRFSKKDLTTLKMLATLGTVSTIIITFSGCRSIKSDIEKITTTIPETGYVHIIDESTTINLTTQPSTEKYIESTIKHIIEQDTTKEQTTITTTRKQPNTKKPVTTTKEEQDYEYIKLLEQLNKNLKNKEFSEEVNMLFLDTFKLLYKNYPEWRNGYIDMPTRENYIKNNLIDIIPKINEINFYDKNSKEADDLLNEGLPLAWTELDEYNNIKVNVISESSNTTNKQEREDDIENFFHEITHCKEANLSLESEYFEDSVNLEQIFTEGRSYISYEIYKTKI